MFKQIIFSDEEIGTIELELAIRVNTIESRWFSEVTNDEIKEKTSKRIISLKKILNKISSCHEYKVHEKNIPPGLEIGPLMKCVSCDAITSSGWICTDGENRCSQCMTLF